MNPGVSFNPTGLTLYGKEIMWRERYTISMPKPSVIPEEGRINIQTLVRDLIDTDKFSWRTNTPEKRCLNWYELPWREEDEWEWVIKKGKLAGTLPRRVSSQVYKDTGVKLTPETLSQIGNIARAYTQGANEYTFDFTNVFDWDDGDFGDSGSCYWGGRSGAKDMILSANGFALRFYNKSGNGFGRCWLIPHDRQQYVVLFNIYGFNGTNIAVPRILSEFLGVPYHGSPVQFTNNGYSDQTLWINNGTCWLVGPDTVDAAKIRPIDLHIDDEDMHSCSNCGDGCGEDYEYHGDYYCEECWYELFVSCEHCGGTLDRDDAFYDERRGEYYCDYHRNRLYSQCKDCDEWVREDLIRVEDVGISVCESCAESYATCDHCGDLVKRTHEVENEAWCIECMNNTFECDGCGKTFKDEHLTYEQGERTYCPGCADEACARDERAALVEAGQLELELV